MDSFDALRRVLQAVPQIRLAYVFGSSARGEETERSDIDVAFLAVPPLDPSDEARLREDLENSAGRDIDLVDLRSAPPLLLRDVVREGRSLVCRSEDERASFELRAISEYLDTQRLRDVQVSYLRGRVEAIRGPQA